MEQVNDKSKWFKGLILGQAGAIISIIFLLGSWVSEKNTHVEDKEVHLSPSELKVHFMPVEEAKAEFRAVNQKLDLLIEMQSKK